MSPRTFFPSLRSSMMAGAMIAGMLVASARAQDPVTSPATQTMPQTAPTTPATTPAATSTQSFPQRGKKPKGDKSDKVVESTDTRKANRANKKTDALAGVDAKLPDKQLYDKALDSIQHGRFDVARLDLQTMLNTYPDSQYQMRAKLAIADSWYKEGGTAALTQAESEYADFRVFFPNAPEAAEAQMRIGDIYFRQMDRPDRDYAKALNAETEYRRMLTDYPDSVLVPQARQRLRDVQEVLATRESDIAAYYQSHDNYAAAIARYQTVADSYPLYSHMDDVLIGLGDAYEALARNYRSKNLPEAGKARLLQLYDGKAADYYRKVVLEHAAAPHVEDAKDRLAAMDLPIPTPTKAQLDASVALENSRSTYRISDRARLLVLHAPDTVLAAHAGEPTLTDPKATIAPGIYKQTMADFTAAFVADAPAPGPIAPAPAAGTSAPVAAPAAPVTPAAPLAFQDVPTAGDSRGTSGTTTLTPSSPSTSGGGGASMGVEIVTPSASSARPSTADPVLKPVGPPDQAALPPIEKPAAAPDVPNEAAGQNVTPGQTPNAKGKNAPAPLDKKDESSSKKKTGLDKLNPF